MKDKRLNGGVCPRCHGTGFSRAFNKRQKYTEEIRNKAIKLFDKGFTLRKIAKELGMNHPQSVSNLLYK